SAAAGPLPILVASACMTSLFFILASAQAASGHEWRPAASALVVVVLGVGLGNCLVPAYGIIGAATTSAAMATTAALVGLWSVAHRFHFEFPLRTLARSIGAVAPAMVLIAALPPGRLATPLYLLPAAMLYCVLLVAIGELTEEDWGLLLRYRLVGRAVALLPTALAPRGLRLAWAAGNPGPSVPEGKETNESLLV
nr:polysaccharide biosynthesis C-terminal domain-containing protein [Dehalococcoidales bacterium]